MRSLRYYEEVGLLHSQRSPSGQRHYTDSGVGRVVFIQRLFAAGMSSRTILEVLPCVDAPSMDTSDAAMERMSQEHDRLTRHIAEPELTRQSLAELMAVNRAHRAHL